ncbi:tRNA pseudouridine(55) synthase TruB [Clostridia bacterium]|nr:tRNA pseudouridine(55) synthase TruB [Clostridia bacterium]
MHGFINLKKEKGWTSHDVVAKLRGILKTKRIGHTGTLDPEVEGVLVIAVGKATKMIQYMEDVKKTYVAEITFGLSTDTEDMQGRVLEQRLVEADELANLRCVLSKMKGQIEQIPPMYSAVKINGQKLYKLARKGQEIERPTRTIRIYDNKLLYGPVRNEENWTAGIEVVCSKGTYIRTYCKDLAAALGTIGVMSDLKRTKVGIFDISDSLTIQEIEDMTKNNDDSFLQNIGDVVPGKKYTIQNDKAVERAKHGNSLSLKDMGIHKMDEVECDEPLMIYLPDGTLLGVAVCIKEGESFTIRMKKVFIA